MSRQRSMEVIEQSEYVTIGELVRLTGVRYSTLKFYTEEGMLPFEQAEENLTRRYRREESIEMIYKIRKMREEKMTIPEIKGKIKMVKIRIIKKNNDCSMEYEVGDICEVTGTWYGGVHINGRSGIPVSLDKEEYMELNTEPEIEEDDAEETNRSETPEHDIHVGDIVQHFKREWVSADTSEYLYKILAVAHHTENGEKLMIYQALYAPFKICARPYDMFMSEVDREKYPDIKQKYRFEKVMAK